MLSSPRKDKCHTTVLPCLSITATTTAVFLCPQCDCCGEFLLFMCLSIVGNRLVITQIVESDIFGLYFYVLEHCQSCWNHRSECLAQRNRISPIYWRRGHLWSSKHRESKSKNRGNEFCPTSTSLLLNGSLTFFADLKLFPLSDLCLHSLGVRLVRGEVTCRKEPSFHSSCCSSTFVFLFRGS